MGPLTRLDRRVFLRDVGSLGASTAGLALLSSACALLPSATRTRMPRIGYLSPGPRESFAELADAFLVGLRELGYVEGQTIAIEWRFTTAGNGAQFPEMAAELVRLPVDVIVAANITPAAQAAKQATSTIPIVAIVARPVETGLVASLARPGGNLTALAASPRGTASKKLELAQDVVPGLARVAALVDATNPNYDAVVWNEIRTAAEQAGLNAERIDLRSAEDVEAAFEAAALSRADAVYGAQNPLLLPVRARVGALSLQHRLPYIFEARDYVVSGCLMSWGTNFPALNRRAAVYVDKILKGAKPGDLPVEQPTVFDLVINVKTLQALGLTIPPSVAPLVTEWIQ